jgi:hypothetical protein
MLKTISAALLAVAVLAAPAMAATTATTAPAPIVKTMHKPAIKSVKAKHSVLNANARMGRHHHRHHRFHKHMGALKGHTFSKVSVKHATPAVKRG